MTEKIARDKISKAVVVLDNSGLEEYKKQKNIFREKDKRIKSLEERLSRLESLIDKLNI